MSTFFFLFSHNGQSTPPRTSKTPRGGPGDCWPLFCRYTIANWNEPVAWSNQTLQKYIAHPMLHNTPLICAWAHTPLVTKRRLFRHAKSKKHMGIGYAAHFLFILAKSSCCPKWRLLLSGMLDSSGDNLAINNLGQELLGDSTLHEIGIAILCCLGRQDVDGRALGRQNLNIQTLL